MSTGAEELIRRLAAVERRLEQIETRRGLRVPVSEDNVGNPPTDAQLDSAFGDPATMGQGFIGLVDDAGAGARVWLCVSLSGSWWVELLNVAV